MTIPSVDTCVSGNAGCEQARKTTGQGTTPSSTKALPWYKLKKKYGVRQRDALAYKMSFFLGVVVLAVLGVNLGVILLYILYILSYCPRGLHDIRYTQTKTKTVFVYLVHKS